jgi:hypothetical protein
MRICSDSPSRAGARRADIIYVGGGNVANDGARPKRFFPCNVNGGMGKLSNASGLSGRWQHLCASRWWVNNGNKVKTAHALGVHQNTLRQTLASLGIAVERRPPQKVEIALARKRQQR